MAKLPFPTTMFQSYQSNVALPLPARSFSNYPNIGIGEWRSINTLFGHKQYRRRNMSAGLQSCMFCLVETKRSFENGFFRQSFWVILAPTWIFQSGFGLTRCYSCFFLQSSSDVTERKHFPATWSQYNFTPVCSIFPKLKRKLKPVCWCFSRCQCTGYSLQFCSLSQLQQMKWTEDNIIQNVLIGYQRYVHNFQFLKINLESSLKTNLSCSVIAWRKLLSENNFIIASLVSSKKSRLLEIIRDFSKILFQRFV